MLLKILLYPFSFLYGIIILIRNKLFEFKILKTNEFRIPIISVGNITVGGTGKTPHIEYLINLLQQNYKVAFLSRGYKRKSSGFIIANEDSTYKEIGDEPFQIKKKFPDILVAVDANRVSGIKKIIEFQQETDVILLDDAFQHRSVLPGINILLVDFNRPIFYDSLLPAGRLREPVSEHYRANIIIVTKTPVNVAAIDKRLFLMKINTLPHQKEFFTSIQYDNPKPVFDNKIENLPDFNDKNLTVLLVTGIANPTPLIKELSAKYINLQHVRYPDHYAFTKDDIDTLLKKAENLPGKNKVIITTEKDAARLQIFGKDAILPEKWFYIPIKIVFQEENEHFNRNILHYVQNNNRNSILYKK